MGQSGKKCVFCLSEHQQERQPQKQPRNISVEHVGKLSVRLKSLKFGVFSWGSGSQSQKAQGKYHKSCAEFSFKINVNISVGGYSNTVTYTCICIFNMKCFVLLYVHQCHSGKQQGMSFKATLPVLRDCFAEAEDRKVIDIRLQAIIQEFAAF